MPLRRKFADAGLEALARIALAASPAPRPAGTAEEDRAERENERQSRHLLSRRLASRARRILFVLALAGMAWAAARHGEVLP